MEVLLMMIALQALCLRQGIHAAVIPSNENGTVIGRSDELDEKQNTGVISRDCSETLLALYHGRWVAVTLSQQSNGTKKDMSRLCRDLDCGLFAENVSSSMNICLSDCTIINSNLYNCKEAAPDNCSNVVKVICAWQAVQLVGGSDRCAGRVELFGTEGWGSVCDDRWDLQGGNVVCAQLGCGTAVKVMGEAGDFEVGSGPIHISELNCSGTERNLWQCATKTDKEKNYCGHKEDASVVCSEGPEVRQASQASWQDNSDTSSDSDYEHYSPDPLPPSTVNNLKHTVGQFYPEVCKQTTPLHNTGKAAKNTSQALDSDSTSSEECYKNTKPELDNVLNPDMLIQPCTQMSTLNAKREPDNNAQNSVDAESKSFWESYKNTEPEPFLQTVGKDPALPEQTPLCHTTPQLAENSRVSQTSFTDLDENSTSSEDSYENLAELDKNYFARSDQSVHSSTDNDYDDVNNW
ncbi:T-cell differentiation antigen CD6 [Bagarius yarrelli]|uniref:T-cell differentiation antigen CD6 n=1 Tax=Bagarius yarrelli TaxID=175774 RepID=A0A556V926_BAGYA|nr:T-cell differentiation antigen CD6 [Bagarius yarrelli]